MRANSLRRIAAIFILLAMAVTGCTSNRNAQFQAQQAYLQGQQQAMAAEQEAKHPSVFVQGSVKNSQVQWVDGLTVAQTIVAAEYQGITNPRTIRLVRNRQPTDIKVSDLLKGNDIPVQPNDVIIILY